MKIIAIPRVRWRKGILVTDPPYVWYLEDTDGDGKADVRKKVLSGFAFELAAYMARPEAKQALGLTNTTIVAVAAAGVIRISEALTRTFRHAVSISFVKTS